MLGWNGGRYLALTRLLSIIAQIIAVFWISRVTKGLYWRARQESNLRPLASEANTLSTELRAL